MAKPMWDYGTFTHGVPYLRFGQGAKTLLFLLGGPGNTLPVGAAAAGFLRGMRGFCEEYTIYLAGRKSSLPQGYTTRNMADDYAELIREDFGGSVDVLIGFSFGGLIVQHFAADHAELAGHIIIGGAAHKISAAAKQIDSQYAAYISCRADRAAMAVRAGALFPPGICRSLLAKLLWLVGPALLGPVSDVFRKDVLVEANAELTHDSMERLRRIRVPVLIVCGKDDFAFALRDVEEMARLIPQATLKVYTCGHSSIFLDKCFVRDVQAFVRQSN